LSGPIPARVDGAAEARLLELIDDATEKGWSLARTCSVLQLDRVRAYRWAGRRDKGTLDDRAPAGNPIHGLIPDEEDAIIELLDTWGPVDLSHRKLAHRVLSVTHVGDGGGRLGH
jgi:putative transposase